MSKLREKFATLNKTAVDYKQMQQEEAEAFKVTWDTTFEELSKMSGE